MITVFTPTYNRGHLLERLWESLERQNYKNFEWIVVDDGSIDNTEPIMKNIKAKASFSILYKKKKNEGKHIAINEGAKLASGEWFFIVDSDDYLSSDSLQVINYYCNQVSNDKSFAGVAGLRGNKDGEAWLDYLKKGKKVKRNTKRKYYEKEYVDADYIQYKYVLRASGDRAEVVRTNLLLEYPFPQFSDEKFLVESYFWMNLALRGLKFRWFNKVIYYTEYRDDGLTKNISNAYANSPIGSLEVANLRLKCTGVPMNLKIRSIYNYYRYGALAKRELIDLVKNCNNKILSPIGIALAFIRP